MERLDHLIEKQEQLRRDEESRNQQVLDAFKSLHPPTTVAKEKVEVTPKLEVCDCCQMYFSL